MSMTPLASRALVKEDHMMGRALKVYNLTLFPVPFIYVWCPDGNVNNPFPAPAWKAWAFLVCCLPTRTDSIYLESQAKINFLPQVAFCQSILLQQQ